jgi:hypothetical protein
MALSESEKEVIKSYCIKQIEEPELFINAIDSWYCSVLDQIDFNSYQGYEILDQVSQDVIDLILEESCAIAA